MGDIVDLNVVTKLGISPDRVITKASYAGLTDVLVLGFDADGQFYAKSSDADGGAVLWLMELCRARLMEIARESSDI